MTTIPLDRARRIPPAELVPLYTSYPYRPKLNLATLPIPSQIEDREEVEPDCSDAADSPITEGHMWGTAPKAVVKYASRKHQRSRKQAIERQYSYEHCSSALNCDWMGGRHLIYSLLWRPMMLSGNRTTLITPHNIECLSDQFPLFWYFLSQTSSSDLGSKKL